MTTQYCSGSPLSGSSQLVALTLGIFPYADPLVCGDLTGPCSLLGEDASVPKPVCFWHDQAFSLLSNCSEKIAFQRSVVLWKKEEQAACEKNSLAVPVPMFLAGTATSTFDLAWYLYEYGFFTNWTSIVCTAQKKGRGQLRRAWHSPQGNLYVSFRLPDDPAFFSSAGAVIVGYLVVEALKSQGFDVFLKWPNDILSVEGKKIGGVLLEERNGVLVAGLGLNLAEAPPAELLRKNHAADASVLLPASGRGAALAPFFIWRSLVGDMIVAYKKIIKHQPLATILQKAEAHLAWRGKKIGVRDADTVLCEGQCIGFGASGGLMIQLADGSCEEVISGSIALLRA